MSSKLNRITPEALRGNPRATLSSWLKYEAVITAAFQTHPITYVYTPSNRSANTMCSQLRDAVRGRIAFDYPSKVATVDLLRWYSEVVFRHDGKSVYIGPPEKVQETITGTGSGGEKTDTTLNFPELTFEEVTAFCCLLSTQRLVGPIVIQRPPDLTLLQEPPNVAIVPREDGSVVLL